MRNVFHIPWTEREHVPCMPIVNMFIEWVRANNYPVIHTAELIFEGAPHTALCSIISDDIATIDWVEAGMPYAGKDEHLHRFEGGWVLQYDRQFDVYVDRHLYFFDF